MANNFKPWVDSPTAGQQVQSAQVFAADTQRVDGFKAGDSASALRVNSALRQANIVVAGLMQMCDDIKTLPNGLSLMSSITEIKNAIKAAIDQLDNMVLASAKSYTNTRESVINGKITNVQNQVTLNKNSINTLEPRVDSLEDEVAALSGGSSTLGQRVTTLEGEMDTAQADITQLKALEPRVDNLEDEVASLSGGSSTLGPRVTTLESEMDAAQADITQLESKMSSAQTNITQLESEMDTAQANITQLKGYYEVNLTTSSWSGSSGNYSYSISAAIHKRGTRPRVHTYVNGEETYDSPKIDWSTGNVTVYSNAQIALKVLIY